MDNQKLSARVEALEGPRYSVECEIYKAVAPDEYHRRLEVLMNGPMKGRIGPADFDGYIKPPNYLASLDAAMSLVPEGWSIGLGDLRGYDPIVWRAHLRDHNDPDAMKRKWFEGHAPTPALALCAAALKARGL